MLRFTKTLNYLNYEKAINLDIRRCYFSIHLNHFSNYQILTMKTLLLSIIFLLPGLGDLMTSIDEYWNIEKEARIKQFEVMEQKPWTKFLPSVGVAYNLQGQPRPSVSISLNKIYDNLQQKQIREVTKEGIIRGLELERQQNKLEVQELYLNLLNQNILFEISTEQAKIDSILFSFTEQEYNKPIPEILPSEYFQRKKNYISVEKGLLIESMKLKELERRILTQAHYYQTL